MDPKALADTPSWDRHSRKPSLYPSFLLREVSLQASQVPSETRTSGKNLKRVVATDPWAYSPKIHYSLAVSRGSRFQVLTRLLPEAGTTQGHHCYCSFVKHWAFVASSWGALTAPSSQAGHSVPTVSNTAERLGIGPWTD